MLPMNATRRSGGLPGTRITRPSWQAFRRITERTYKMVNENAPWPRVMYDSLEGGMDTDSVCFIHYSIHYSPINKS
ncbi:hypothetical protein I7I50_01168 [Histoplasma capsulatum G186AR]|uniref:Uncharacterized protein n=1 Tax=Ajellomyces capsulatus TaxID=5037 RepID=A0A8H7YXG8_AJECA|nr:hypothetical protein I7I52_09005 [Histoplasma capsulatum]QSS73120.1 hypothetical protein I7I50_01168 [Histoplasma capsulatum G186AR]